MPLTYLLAKKQIPIFKPRQHSDMIIDRYHLHEDAPEKIPFSIYALDQYLQANTINTIRPHIHSFYQIIWFTNGEGQHFVDFNSYPVKKDTIFFIAKDQVHNFDSPKGYDGILFHFNESFLVQNSPDMGMIFKYNISSVPLRTV